MHTLIKRNLIFSFLCALVAGMRSDSFVRSLRQTTVKPSQMKLVKGRDAFDSLESLCSYVESEAARNRKASPPSKISITR